MKPIVSIIMGSTSDYPVMEKAAKFLNEMEIPFEINALSAHRTPEQVEKFAKNAGNNGIKVIILKSAGDRAFCAGASFDELLSIDDIDTGKEFFMGFARVINAARKCPKFIIGRVQGKAVGGGLEWLHV